MVGALTHCAADVTGVARQYSGTAVTMSTQIMSTSAGITVTNANGSVWVDTAGSPSAPCGGGSTVCTYVSVTAEPFATGSDDTSATAAANALQAAGGLQVVGSASGGVAITAQGDITQGFGYDLTVHVPYPFGGPVTIDAANGYVHYVGSSGANSANITVGNGDVYVQDGGKSIDIQGGTAPGGRSNITVITLPTVQGFNISTSSGNISAQIPQATVLLISARAATGGTVTPPPNKDVYVTCTSSSDDSSDDTPSGAAISVVAPDHRSATVTLGSPFLPSPTPAMPTPAQMATEMQLTSQCLSLGSTATGNTGQSPLAQCMTVWTGNGNIVFH
jgi:hypothetical protein